MQAINGHLSLAHSYFAPDDEIMQENITVGEWRKRYLAKSGNRPSQYGGFAYDAIWVYAHALDKLYRNDPFAVAKIHQDSSTSKFVELIQRIDFTGVSGRIKFGTGASRKTVINILQWINNKTNIVGSFYPNISDEGGPR